MKFIGSHTQLAAHFRTLAARARQESLSQKTIREARFHDGKAQAWDSTADVLEKFELKEGLESLVIKI